VSMTRSDRDWERFARSDPYWAVVTDPRFTRGRLNQDGLRSFFEAGARHIDVIFDAIHRFVQPGFAPERALDFGCGVGRLTVPLARRARQVVAVDVSETMLREARANCAARGLANVAFRLSDDRLSAVTEEFNLVHSFIVLQHIPCRRGERLFRALVARLADGGVGVIHVTYSKEPPAPSRSFGGRLLGWARGCGRGVRALARGLGLHAGRPLMQMNDYHLNPLFLQLQGAGVRRVHVEYTDHGGCYGVILMFRKDPGGCYLA